MLGSLRSRLALTNLAVTLVALLALTVLFAQLLRQRGIDSAKQFVVQEAHLVQLDVDRELPRALSNQISLPQLYAFFGNDVRFVNKRVIFYSANGDCAFDSAGKLAAINGGCVGAERGWLVVHNVDRGLAASGFVTSGGKTYFVAQKPTKIPRHGSAAVVLVANGSEVIPPLTAVAPGFLLAILAATIIWLVMAAIFGYTVSRPLGRVSAAARGIAAGDYSQTVDISGGGEIVELATSFNYMVTRVRAANQLLKDFVANVSHDLRTPLTLISGYAGSVLDGTAKDEPDVHEAVRVIADEAGRMARLVDDLLAITRLESGLKTFELKPVSIPRVVERTIPRVEAAAGGREIANAVSNGLPLALGDEELLERVLTNLLANAVEYTPSHGSVEVSASATDDWIEVN
ncbi:MAG TPA: histidine kinase dimerization/phospho-acceptor domain-containing protein, partial [Chloroflexota bacterium]|nr:histidine kinase dimerization/phospho-acceptor domain-containing protein [Chloroflexota bacterium]